jgi:hypothetical protein
MEDVFSCLNYRQTGREEEKRSGGEEERRRIVDQYAAIPTSDCRILTSDL